MEGKSIAIVLLLLAIVGIGGYAGFKLGWFKFNTPTTAGTTTTQPQQVIVVQQPGTTIQQPVPVPTAPTGTQGSFPVETLYANTKDKFTMQPGAVQTGTNDYWIQFYTPGADVSDPYVSYLDRINVSGGDGTTTATVIQTNTPYDVYFNGQGVYYDQKINFAINYNPETGKGYLMADGLSYVPITKVGTFTNVDTLPEIQNSTNNWNTSGTDTIYYDESVNSGSAWIRVDIGNDAANSELRNVVMCFKDADGDMENNEITALTATYVSGTTAINIPGNLITYWQDAMGGSGPQCFQIANVLGSSQKARWEFTFTAEESNWDAGEEFEMCWDDLGDYLEKQYPSRNVKAAAECLTIGNQA